MNSFRFIHTGDIHLDSPLKGLSGQDGAAADRIRTATRAAFHNLITRAIEEEVAFIIIAGDLYDGDWRDYHTGLFFVKQMGRLAKAGIGVFLLYGNHDAESQITRRLVLPENVNVFSARKPQTFRRDDLSVALHGQSFKQRDVTDDLVPAYPALIGGLFNIGVLHTGLGGMGGHANYAPCTLDELVNKGYDYWALAHVHQAAVLHERPHIVFCGNLQGRHIRETGQKAASLVTVEDRQVVDISPLHMDVVRWVHLVVTVDHCTHTNDAIDAIRKAIEHQVASESEGRLLACRIELTGRTEIHGQLLASEEYLIAEARAAALGIGDEAAWIERVVVSTIDPSSTALRMDALGDLQRMIGSAAEDTTLRAQFESELGDLVRKLPHDVRGDVEDVILKAAIDGDYVSLIAQVGDYLTARLATEGV
ncbi:DNA repair exonuclease [Bradyrhizobium sp. G127]|uniref:metallophosphoesterase family protein n=1 Tax=Bradyrhizobium sp. G127 TaxID=2904800 RepID=UPI001F2DE0C3|nr:DNA repair exonuclease [Bradyrhizobium sp. G127]MCF2523220.1 DNA repair exonuclease [Bradyrhizobium sp. G127]